MLIRLSVRTALEVYLWSNFNTSTDSSRTKHETLLGIITFLIPLFWNLGKFDDKNKDSKVYSFVFLTPFYKLQIPILYHIVMEGILINTPKMR